MYLTIGNPRPKDKPPPGCPRILGWTINYASTHHFKISLPLALTDSENLCLPLLYHIICTNLSRSSFPGALTLVVLNSMVIQVSCISLLVAYKVFATRLWNSTTFPWSSFLQSSFTTKILFGAALDFVTFPLMFSFSEAVSIS